MTTANMKKLEAAHQKWQRKILGITWQDRVTNDEVRRSTGMLKTELHMMSTGMLKTELHMLNTGMLSWNTSQECED